VLSAGQSPPEPCPIPAVGYLKYDSYESILLTEAGRTTGAYLLERHNIIERFFLLLGSDNPLVETELVEHVLSASTVLKIEALLSFMQNPDIHKQYKSLRDAVISPEFSTILDTVEKGGF
jgi:Mn-dependent DtxR family transcriptional regulator